MTGKQPIIKDRVFLLQGARDPSSVFLLSLRSVCSYFKQQPHVNLWLNINHRADRHISNPGIERKPHLRHQLLNIEFWKGMHSKQPFPDLSTLKDIIWRAQLIHWYFNLYSLGGFNSLIKSDYFKNNPLSNSHKRATPWTDALLGSFEGKPSLVKSKNRAKHTKSCGGNELSK